MSSIDRIGSPAMLYTRGRPQDVSQPTVGQTPQRSVSLNSAGSAPSIPSNLANALWLLQSSMADPSRTLPCRAAARARRSKN